MSAEAYLKLIERTNEGCYFLWGPIRNALLMELAQGNTELIAEICTGGSLNRERRMPVERKDMLIQVLTMAVQGQGEKDREKHRARIHNLLEQIVEPGFRRQQMLGPRSFVETKKLAAQVAGQLQFSDILKPLMLDRDEDVRRTAVRSTFYLWKEDKALGLQILRELGDPDKVSHWLVPSIRRLHSCFELTLSILFEDYGEPTTTDHLHKIWAGVFGRILLQQGHRNEGRQPSSPRVVRLARSFVLRQVVNLAIRLARYLEKERLSVYDIREVELFFESSSGMDEVKQSFRRLVPYMDFRAGDLEDVKSDLERLTLSRDVLSCYLLATILGAHVSVRPKRTAAIIEELFEEAVRVESCSRLGCRSVMSFCSRCSCSPSSSCGGEARCSPSRRYLSASPAGSPGNTPGPHGRLASSPERKCAAATPIRAAIRATSNTFTCATGPTGGSN